MQFSKEGNSKMSAKMYHLSLLSFFTLAVTLANSVPSTGTQEQPLGEDITKGLDELITGKAGIGEPCFVDSNCDWTPVVECYKENGSDVGLDRTTNGECKFTSWFIDVLAAVACCVIAVIALVILCCRW